MISIDIDDREVKQALQTLQRRLGDMTPAMREIGEVLIETTKQRFVTSTAPDGSRWAPNSPATIMQYLRARGGAFGKRGGLTKRGARLAASKKPLIGETRSLSTQISYRAGRASVEVGSPMEYAPIHQFGGRSRLGGKMVRIPARPFLGLSASDKRSVLEIIEEHLTG